MKLISETKALAKLHKLKQDFKAEISNGFEHRAKSCVTCETQGACCLDAHFVNIHISRLESKAIRIAINKLGESRQNVVYDRIEQTIDKYDLSADGDTFAQTYACPLFEKGTGCLVHAEGKPVPCIQHACYENAADLPPDSMQVEQEKLIDDLNRRTYGRASVLLPLPVALSLDRRHGPVLQNEGHNQTR
jgi:hypothetical protein